MKKNKKENLLHKLRKELVLGLFFGFLLIFSSLASAYLPPSHCFILRPEGQSPFVNTSVTVCIGSNNGLYIANSSGNFSLLAGVTTNITNNITVNITNNITNNFLAPTDNITIKYNGSVITGNYTNGTQGIAVFANQINIVLAFWNNLFYNKTQIDNMVSNFATAGICPSGFLVQNTTTGGVDCYNVTGISSGGGGSNVIINGTSGQIALIHNSTQLNGSVISQYDQGINASIVVNSTNVSFGNPIGTPPLRIDVLQTNFVIFNLTKNLIITNSTSVYGNINLTGILQIVNGTIIQTNPQTIAFSISGSNIFNTIVHSGSNGGLQLATGYQLTFADATSVGIGTKATTHPRSVLIGIPYVGNQVNDWGFGIYPSAALNSPGGNLTIHGGQATGTATGGNLYLAVTLSNISSGTVNQNLTKIVTVLGGNGNVGIRNANPTSTLDVNGTLNVTGRVFGNYSSLTGTPGFSGTCTILGLTSITVQNGIITGCT